MSGMNNWKYLQSKTMYVSTKRLIRERGHSHAEDCFQVSNIRGCVLAEGCT